MTTRTNARANNNASRDMNNNASQYTSHDVLNDDERAMMIAHDNASRDVLRDEYGVASLTTNDDATNDTTNIVYARITRKLTKRDRARLRDVKRDETSMIAHNHNARWNDVAIDVEILRRLNIEHKLIDA